ncbi:MAG: glucose-1-phosphate thymidylyltransferase RfbA [Bauldia sp.]
MTRKGIILAGGAGTRLHPLTLVVSKQLLPVYDKPLIYYPLTALMLAGIRDVLVIATPDDAPHFHRLLGDGARWGISIAYAVQPKPEGLAQALVIAAPFLGGEPSCLALGDNLIYGNGLSQLLQGANSTDGATVFAYHVDDPSRYGVVDLDGAGRPLAIEEKPLAPRSPWAVIGLYFYDGSAPDRARALKPSARGEYEITDLHKSYLADAALHVVRLGRGFAWFDAGTHASLLDAGEFIRVVQRRQRYLVGSPEEVAHAAGWITTEDLARQADALGNTEYAATLKSITLEAAR